MLCLLISRRHLDTVDHGRLLSELDILGIGNPLLSWLRSYLTNRKQFVKIHSVTSSLSTIPSRVPQEAHLSPLLFILFINSFNNYLSNFHVLLFADDIKLYRKISFPTGCSLLQADLDFFCTWLQRVGLNLNIDKCKVMYFCRSRPPFFIPTPLTTSHLNVFIISKT